MKGLSLYLSSFALILHFSLNSALLHSSMKGCRNQRLHFLDLFKRNANHEEKGTAELISMFGYPVQRHETMTQDGYFLTLFRIPHSNLSAPAPHKTPVFCMHGVWSSSAQWFWQPPQRALVFMLVNAGYDVWLGNARGTTYSQKHLHFPVNDPKDLRYWNYSQTEYSKYDVPAFVDLILRETGESSLYWIGHSLGAGTVLGAFGYNPQLNQQIRTIFALAPAVFADQNTNIYWRAPAPIYAQHLFLKKASAFGFGRLLPKVVQKVMHRLTSLCQISFLAQTLCASIVHAVLGYSCQLDPEMLGGGIAHVPDVISVKTLSHVMQVIESGAFREYDYGLKGNQEVYGQPSPPHFDLSQVKVPVVIFYSQGDNMIVPQDIGRLVESLGSSVKELIEVDYPAFTHADFVIGLDADRLIYDHIIRVMNSTNYLTTTRLNS